jgi:hypothetical protein
VVVDANEFLVDTHRKKRPRDLACVGACFPDFDKQAEVVFYQLDPWELSTTSDIWYQQALSSGAMLVSKKIVPNLLLSDLLKQHYPKNTAQKKILNIDVDRRDLIRLTTFRCCFLMLDNHKPMHLNRFTSLHNGID